MAAEGPLLASHSRGLQVPSWLLSPPKPAGKGALPGQARAEQEGPRPLSRHPVPLWATSTKGRGPPGPTHPLPNLIIKQRKSWPSAPGNPNNGAPLWLQGHGPQSPGAGTERRWATYRCPGSAPARGSVARARAAHRARVNSTQGHIVTSKQTAGAQGIKVTSTAAGTHVYRSLPGEGDGVGTAGRASSWTLRLRAFSVIQETFTGKLLLQAASLAHTRRSGHKEALH